MYVQLRQKMAPSSSFPRPLKASCAVYARRNCTLMAQVDDVGVGRGTEGNWQTAGGMDATAG